LRKVNDSITDLLSKIYISDLAETSEHPQSENALASGLVSILV